MLSEAPTITYNDTYISSVDVMWLKSFESPKQFDGINAGNSEDIQIKVTTKDIDESILPEESLSISITFTMNWIEGDGNEKIVEPPHLVELVSGDGTQVGDELKIGEEHFYVVSNDGTNAVLFAKYNLEVGKIYTKEPTYFTLVDIESPSGLQNEKALGYVNVDAEYYGVVPFSSSSYWHSGNIKSEYGTSYPVYVYDDNASIKAYVDNYADYLEELGISIKEARLIKREELLGIGCNTEMGQSCKSAPCWVYSTTYWTGIATSSSSIGRVNSIGDWSSYLYNIDTGAGVRPVIVISSSEI
jgi:hypothetical protein